MKSIILGPIPNIIVGTPVASSDNVEGFLVNNPLH